MGDKTTDSLQNRIDNFTIAYVQAHYDVKNMSIQEYMDKIAEVSHAIFDWYRDRN